MRRLPVLVALGLCVGSPALAQIGGTPFEISGQAGIASPDARARVKTGPAFDGALGWRLQTWFVFEGHALFAPSKRDDGSDLKRNFMYAGLDMRMNMRPAYAQAVPFVLGGLGYASSHDASLTPEKLNRGAPSLGLGLLLNTLNQRTYLRIQVRDTWFRERHAKSFGNNLAATIGLQYALGGKPRDADLDGVRDWLDACPGTPIGAAVDSRGCPKDADADSVFDGLDKCPDTPRGCKVDRNGCPSDADGDGVCDGVDQCADTPKGASVDATGCPNDEDGDGVVKGVDACEGTLKGCQVDEKGCPKDADGDGVCDGLDQCPGTSAGLKVDAKGCPIQVIERETELMDTGKIRLQDVNFETGKAEILPESHATLDIVGQVLTKWPELKIEIGGHTDARGSNAANQKLSEARAGAVLGYLRTKFPALPPDQFSVRGYGESRPIAPNTTDIGMAKNRRVEFVVLNKDVLRREVERRRLLRKDEGGASTPPGSTPPENAPAPPEPSIPAPEPAPPDTSTTPR